MPTPAYPLPSATVGRPESNPILALIRAFHRTESKLVRKAIRLAHKLAQYGSSCDIPLECAHIGEGLLLPHRAIGVVIHPDTVIGVNACIFHGVTIGQAGGVPTLGNCVEIGPGAMLFGGITVGDYAQIAPGAIVTKDVPAYSLVMGANIIKPNTHRFPNHLQTA